MAIRVATLNGLNLPTSFRYKPYVPKKRANVTPTANAVITQAAASSQIVHGGGVLSWRQQAACPEEFQTYHNLYNVAALTLYDFVGYWGEEYEVRMATLSVDNVYGGLMDVSGTFQVVYVTTTINATNTT